MLGKKSSLFGLTNTEATDRLAEYGPNIVEEPPSNMILLFLEKFWAPVPWMLEAIIFLQLFLGKFDEALIISVLLLFNAGLSFFQEDRAKKVLTLLKKHLAIQVRVVREGRWQFIAARDLVPGDVVHIRMGDIAPADIRLLKGNLLADQSMLTGEALPVQLTTSQIVYSGSILKQGEATGEIIATGKQTYFGKSIELLQIAKTQSHIKNIILSIVKNLLFFELFLVFIIFLYTLVSSLSLIEIIPFVLILLIAAIPAALPATFTLSTVFEAMHLAKKGVLVTRLSSLEDAATMDILCLDKTGTLTQNVLEIASLYPVLPFTEEQLLFRAMLACDEATQDPIDMAILKLAREKGMEKSLAELLKFIPFDPSRKRTEAIYKINDEKVHIIKGAPDIVTSLASSSRDFSREMNEISQKGYRFISIITSTENKLAQNKFELIGFVAFQDPPRKDTKPIIKKLKELGLRLFVLTGDNAVTARTIGENVGIGTRVGTKQEFSQKLPLYEEYDIFAGLFPEDKFRFIQFLQRNGHVVGMTGDGVNDAPTLKQAEVGIAVASAVDVAKASSALILTQKGLSGILSAIEASRCVYKRMQTYVLNKIIKSLEISVFLSLGFILTKDFVLTPILMVLLLFINDFITMAVATDNVSFLEKPVHWQISNLMYAAGGIAFFNILFSFLILFLGKNFLLLSLEQLQTLIFVMLVFTMQGTVYIVREKDRFWHSLPSRWLLLSSVFAVVFSSILAIKGILMASISPFLIGGLLLIVVFYLVGLDCVKKRIFSYADL